MPPNASIVLDSKHSRSLIRHAMKSNYAVFTEERDEVGKAILASYGKNIANSSALLQAVLYDKLYLYHECDSFDISRLKDALDVEVMRTREAYETSDFYRKPEMHELCRTLKPLLFQRLKREASQRDLWRNANVEVFDTLLELFNEHPEPLSDDAFSLKARLLRACDKNRTDRDVSRLLASRDAHVSLELLQMFFRAISFGSLLKLRD